MLVETGQIGGALPRFRKPLEIFESPHALDPLNANNTRAVAIEYEKLLDAYVRAEDRAAAIPLYRKALDMYREMSAADPSNAHLRSDLERLEQHPPR